MLRWSHDDHAWSSPAKGAHYRGCVEHRNACAGYLGCVDALAHAVIAVKRSTLVVSLLALGAALWLSSRVVETQPGYAVAVMLAFGLFSMFVAARPYPN